MTRTNSSHVGGVALVMLGSWFASALLVGCADVITTSRASQRTGLKFYNNREYAEAAGAFRNAVRQNPRDYQAYYYLGASYEKLGQYQQAIQAYKQGRATLNVSLAGKEDTDFRARLVDGLAHAIAASDERDIETNAATQLANSRQSPEDWFVLAKIYTYRGDPDSAIDAYNRACLLDPKNFTFAKDYGLYLEKVGQTRKAEAPLRRAYAINGHDEQVVAALRRIGVVPGPSLMDQDALAKPPVPKGPIPQLKLGNFGSSSNAPSAAPAAGGSAQVPHD